MKTLKDKLGGGVVSNSNSTAPKNPTKTLGFKPLIATSLALALGMSVASATCTSANGSLAICESNSDISQNLGITWNGLNGGSSNIYQPALNSGNTPIENLTFKFNGGYRWTKWKCD